MVKMVARSMDTTTDWFETIMKYATLKQERDDAVERAVIAERNSQLERVRELEAAHAAELLDLRAQIERLEAELSHTKRAFTAAVDDANALLSLRAAQFKRNGI